MSKLGKIESKHPHAKDKAIKGIQKEFVVPLHQDLPRFYEVRDQLLAIFVMLFTGRIKRIVQLAIRFNDEVFGSLKSKPTPQFSDLPVIAF